MIIDNKKRCRQCGKEKDISEFGSNARNADGLHSECRDCRRQEYRDRHGGLKHALRNFRTDEIIDEVVRRAKIYDLLDELPPEDIAKYLETQGYTVVLPTEKGGEA